MRRLLSAPPARRLLLLLLAAAWPAQPLKLHGLQSLDARPALRGEDQSSIVSVQGAFGRVFINFPTERYNRCLERWQQQCWQNWLGDDVGIEHVCNSSLQRPHLRSHLLLPAQLVRNRMKLVMPRHWQANAAPRLFVPRFTALGWKMVMPPTDMHQRVVEWYESQRYRMIAEDWPALDDVGCNNNYDNDDYLIPHNEAPPVMAMGMWIKKQLEEWMGTEVDPSWHIFYGARLQRRGGTCGLHVDAGETHIMSATYNIAQRRPGKPWPLAFVEPGGHVSKAEQQPGNVVFYEGGSGMHGRPEPLDGEEFVSIYFHFRPKDWLNMYHKAMPSESAFDKLVEVQEPAERMSAPPMQLRALQDDDSCPAEAEDTHSAAGLTELWRPPHTFQRHAFSPGAMSEADVREVVAALQPALDAGAAPQASGLPVLLLQEDPEGGSLGVDRAVWEAAALVARHSGRALVLPADSRLEKELDMDRLRGALPVLTAEEYQRGAGVMHSEALAKSPKADDLCAAAAAGAGAAEAHRDAAEAAVVFSRAGACGGSSDIWRLAAPGAAGEQGRKLLQQGFAWGSEARAAAAKAVHRLGLWDFVAFHANDLGSARVSADVTLARWVGYLQPGSTLYVAGGGAGVFRGRGGPLNVTIVTWEDLQLGKASQEPVEELICAHARLFAGAGQSTGFTGRVRRARVELRAPTTAALYYQEVEADPRDSLQPNRVAAELKIWRQGLPQLAEMSPEQLLQQRREQLNEQGTVEVDEDTLRNSLA